MSRPDSIICCRVPANLKERILQFRSKYHLKTETASIIQLLEVALFVDSKKEDLKDPDVVQLLQANLFEEMLVDWIFGLDDNRLNALYGAFSSARELRYKHKKEKK